MKHGFDYRSSPMQRQSASGLRRRARSSTNHGPLLEGLEARELLSAYQLVPPNALDIGNTWHFTGKVTCAGGVKVNQVLEINQSIQAGGTLDGQTTYDRHSEIAIAGTPSAEQDEYFRLDADNLLMYKFSQSGEGGSHQIVVRNSNPMELLPRVMTGTTFTGDAEFDGSITGGDTWTQTMTNTVTFMGMEKVTVNFTSGAKTVSAAKVKVHLVAIDAPSGRTSTTDDIYWLTSDYGTVKGSHTETDEGHLTTAYTYALTSATLVHPLGTREVTIGDATVTEFTSGNASAKFTVTLSDALPTAVTVGYYTSSGSAMPGDDYVPTGSGKVTIPAGQLTATFSLAVKADKLTEGAETFFAVLQNPPAGVALGADSDGKGTISDPPAISIAAADATITEADGADHATTFTVTSDTAAPAGGLVVNLGFAGKAKLTKDYTLTGVSKNTVTILEGQKTASFTVTAANDHKPTGNLDLTATVKGTKVYNAKAGATGHAAIKIMDIEPVIHVGASAMTLTEASGAGNTVTLTFTTDSAPTADLTVYWTLGGTAKKGVEYSLSDLPDGGANFVIIHAGDTTATLTLTGLDDAAKKGNKTITLTTQKKPLYTLSADSSIKVSLIDNVI